MAIDSHYIPAFSIEDVLLDKDTGAPLSGGLVYFEQDNRRGVLKPVYQITGTSPNYTYTQLPNPMTLSSIGTFEDSLSNPTVPYFYPYDEEGNVEYYYVRVTSSEDVPQFDREAVPYVGTQNNAEVLSVITNELSNPQFVETFFTGTHIFSFSAAVKQVVNIAPDWDIIVTCPTTGTVTVTQTTPSGSLNIITNPGTILTISSAGITALQLRQRIYGSPNLWGSGYLSATFVAKTYSGTAVTLNMYYSQSNGLVVDQLLVSASLPASGNYGQFPGSLLIPASTSNQTFPTAYVDIYFDIPLSIQIDLTSVMLAFTGATFINNISYDQESYARQIDRLFHYYQPWINYKPIPSMLVGWDFPVNPAQFGLAGNISGSLAYIWDQTLAARGATNIAYTSNSVTDGIQFTTAGAVPDAFMLVQYLSGDDAKKILGTPLSVNLNAYRGSAGGEVTYRIYLYRGSAAAVIPSGGNAIGALASSGVFTKNNTAGQGLNWTEIPRGDLGDVVGTLSTVATNDELTNGENDYGYHGWEIIDATEITDTNKFCIVVTFSYSAASTVISVDSISMVPGQIPTRPAPLTVSETLSACQYYYQKSFIAGVTPIQNAGANTGESYGIQVSGAAPSAFGPIIRFPIPMRATPNIVLYNPSAANAQIRDISTGTDWTTSTGTNITSQGFVAIGTTPGGSVAGNGSAVHWSADARLGIV